MDENSKNQPEAGAGVGASQESPAEGSQLRADDNTTLDESFLYDQPYHEDAWDEENIPLSGEINAVDTFITGEQFRQDPFQDLESSERPEMADSDPFDPYRADEFARQNGLTRQLEQARTEFAGELSPSYPGVIRNESGDAREVGHFRAADNGGIQESVPEGNTTFGWIAMLLAIVSLFFWPAVLGPAAVVIGVLAYLKGNRSLGVWSVVLGLIAVAAYLFLIPYFS